MFKHLLHEIRRELTLKIRVSLNYSEEVHPKLNSKFPSNSNQLKVTKNLIIIKHSKL